jgi:CPA1 family monovalent cation:H+ antiporter
MTGLELAVTLATATVALDLLARRIATPRPVVLAAGGLVLGVLWGPVLDLPEFTIPPYLMLGLVLPPLLAAAAFRVTLGAFRASLRPITLLAVVLVLATMAGVAVVTHAVIPDLPWAAAFVLGAAVGPPDSVAATTVAARVGLNNRLTTILEGEGLVNDAVALVSYRLAVTAAVMGEFSWGHTAAEIARSAPLGIVVGLAVGVVTVAVRRRVNDTMVETAVSLLVPYIAYVLAERVSGSSILAVVALGFYLRRRATEIGAPATRLVNRVVWQAVDFLTGGLVFALVGLELGRVMSQVSPGILLDAAAVVSATVGIRLAWMYVVPHTVRLVVGRDNVQVPPVADLTALGWAGPRGVVTLALAIAIPRTTAGGAPFPARNELVALALAVVLATLLGQGLTLEPLIRALGIADPDARAREEREARAAAVHAGSERLDRLAGQGAISVPQRERLLDALRVELRSPGVQGRLAAGLDEDESRALLRALADARGAILARWDDGELNEDAAERLEAELDLTEVELRGTAGKILGE